MSEDIQATASDPRVEATLAAVRREGTGRMSVDRIRLDETAQADYGGVVRAGLLAVYGVPVPARLDRVIAEAAVARVPAERCIEVIGEAFDLRRLPERRRY
jgi:hypothetical protein